MPFFSTSSMLGVDLNNPSTTQLFALNTKTLGSYDTEWQYVVATGTLTTGQIVYVNTDGTANAFTTAQLNNASTSGLDLAVAQFTIAQGSFGWVARRGNNLYVASTGTIPGGSAVGFSPTAGALITGGAVAVGQTAAGIFITTSASTATAAVAVAILTYPRPVAGVPQA